MMHILDHILRYINDAVARTFARRGQQYIGDTLEKNGTWTGILVNKTAVFAALWEDGVANTNLTGVEISAGIYLGSATRFTKITLTSGSVLAYYE